METLAFRVLPHRREEGLLINELPDELLVYDLDRHRAHSLNRTAVLVWRQCDGQTTMAEIATQLQHELNLPVDEGVVWWALDRLGKAHLLRERLTPPADAGRCSRREVMRKWGLVGGLSVLVPVVMSIVAPTAAEAASCVGLGRPCGSGPPCCPGLQCIGRPSDRRKNGICI